MRRESLKPSSVYRHPTHSHLAITRARVQNSSRVTTSSLIHTAGFSPSRYPRQRLLRLQKSHEVWFKFQATLCAYNGCRLRRRPGGKAGGMVLTLVPGKCEHLLQLHSICRGLIEAVEYFEKQRQTLGQNRPPQDRLFSLLSQEVCF